MVMLKCEAPKTWLLQKTLINSLKSERPMFPLGNSLALMCDEYYLTLKYVN